MDFKENRKKLIIEMFNDGPQVIVIKGNSNPTYSSSSFSYILMNTGKDWIEFCGALPAENEMDNFEVLDKHPAERLNEIIKKFEERRHFTLVKYEGEYFIFSILDENDSIENYTYKSPKDGMKTLTLECGGRINILKGG